MSNLTAARFQMAYSLGFHMIFAVLGIGMPALMVIAEIMYRRTKNEEYRRLAKTWAKATGILFAIGAVSGTALSFELGLLWPKFMGFAGSTLGSAFSMEGYAFFTEAIFLGLYLYGRERLTPALHLFSGIMVALSGMASGVLVLATDAWMQNPHMVDVLLTNPEQMDVFAALFKNQAWPVMTVHSTFSAYACTGFGAAAVYAWSALKGKMDAMRRKALIIALGMGTVAAVAMPVTGHISAQEIADRQPMKLAAMEALYRTEKGAPLLVGGVPHSDTQTVTHAIEIPGGLSFLAFNDPKAEVKGLDQIPKENWPNIPVVHYSFQIMVAAGGMMMAVVLVYWWAVARRRERHADDRRLLWLLVIAGPLGFIAMEAGWIVTEVGRQPWIIYGVMKTAEAVTPVPGLATMLAWFVALYAALGVVLVWLLNRLKHA